MTNYERRRFIAASTQAALAASVPFTTVRGQESPSDPRASFRRIRTQFIAALAEPDARSGSNAHLWGLWELDPGPRGVSLAAWQRILQNDGIAPAGWHFDESGWWLEEHGLIMEQPKFPLAPGEYLVTGDRAAVSVLSVQPPDAAGRQAWSLSNDANVYDVTHLRCRSALYTPGEGAGSCSPAQARQTDFPVRPGAPMPPVTNCHKQDYAVLLVIGLPEHT
jgi:hypothetical protein